MPCSHKSCKKIRYATQIQPLIQCNGCPMETTTEVPLDVDFDVKKKYKLVRTHDCKYKLLCKVRVEPKVHYDCQPKVICGHMDVKAAIKTKTCCL